MLELIVDTSKIKILLEQCNFKDCSEEDLVKQEGVLLALSSLIIRTTFNPKNKYIIDIVINNINND